MDGFLWRASTQGFAGTHYSSPSGDVRLDMLKSPMMWWASAILRRIHCRIVSCNSHAPFTFGGQTIVRDVVSTDMSRDRDDAAASPAAGVPGTTACTVSPGRIESSMHSVITRSRPVLRLRWGGGEGGGRRRWRRSIVSGAARWATSVTRDGNSTQYTPHTPRSHTRGHVPGQ